MAKTDGDAQAASLGYPPFNMEYGPNWITTFVFVHWINVGAIVGNVNFSYDDALEEVVTSIFDDDDAVRDLFNFWGLPYTYLT
ncbi:hypothetical protein GM547_13980, partial [Streptococcus pneumoniae]|uniref:hypothetical protein n=1 Tax=Streptococcus pneumoniae TaxID=1313 RepID=UPI0012D713A0